MSFAGKAPGWDTELDLATPETIDADEAERLIRWYEENHGDGRIDLTKFVPFLIHHRPAALKRYRGYLQSIQETSHLPQAATALLWLHYYMIIGYEKGVEYIVIAAREWGASKREVVDCVHLSFLEAGPLGANAVAGRAADYLDRWSESEPRRVADPWPEDWRPPVAGSYVSGMDLTKPILTQSDFDSLHEWHAARDEAVPEYVEFLAAKAPQILKTLRARFQQAHEGTQLPAQLIPLLHLHTAAIRGNVEEARAAAEDARTQGVRAAHAIGALAFAFLYMSEFRIQRITRSLVDVFSDWD